MQPNAFREKLPSENNIRFKVGVAVNIVLRELFQKLQFRIYFAG
jgi:hypothetical protein